MLALGIVALSYLIGTLPTGYLVGRAKGVDIRTLGSGNIGATNVYRMIGKSWGIGVFAIDATKGLAAVRLAMWMASRTGAFGGSLEMTGIVAAVSCILGHSFPLWLQFRGGKGVATSTGTLLGLMPLATVVVFIVWLIFFKTTRYVSVASMAAAVALPITVAALLGFRLARGVELFYFSLIIAALVVWRHRSNVQRLLAGTEAKIAK